MDSLLLVPFKSTERYLSDMRVHIWIRALSIAAFYKVVMRYGYSSVHLTHHQLNYICIRYGTHLNYHKVMLASCPAFALREGQRQVCELLPDRKTAKCLL